VAYWEWEEYFLESQDWQWKKNLDFGESWIGYCRRYAAKRKTLRERSNGIMDG